MEKKEYFEKGAKDRDKFRSRFKYFYNNIDRLTCLLVPEESRVLEVGCSTGSLCWKLKKEKKCSVRGIDFSKKSIRIAKEKYPEISFEVDDVEDLKERGTYDYIIMQNLLIYLNDIYNALLNLKEITHSKSKLLIYYYNYLWEPVVKLLQRLKVAPYIPNLNWLNNSDIRNFLDITGFEVIKKGESLIFPFYIPFLSTLLNRYVARLPLLRNLCFVKYVVAKPREIEKQYKSLYSVSVILPVRNEKGNLESAIKRIPEMGNNTEIIFVENNSTDGTLEELKKLIPKYGSEKDVKFISLKTRGKAEAVWAGFDKARGDVLMILDGDLTVMPEDLPKFYKLIAQGHGEFVNGSRLVYPMEERAMRFLNVLGNKIFSWLFTYLLGQRIKDTLCGTKVIFKKDYLKLKKIRSMFGDFDRYGDFELLFGASALNLKIVEMPVRYQERIYGETHMKRFSIGWLLFKMCFVCAKHIKFV